MKKILAVIMIISILLLLTVGCTGNRTNESETGGKSGTEQSESSTTDGKAGTEQSKSSTTDKVTLTAIAVTHSLTKDIDTMTHIKKMEEAAGVTVQWEQVRSGWGEQKSVLLASGDVPDLFVGWAINDADFSQYPGLFQPLNELIEKFAPNVQKMFADHPELKQLSTHLDGNIYGLPRYQRFWPRNMIRQMINKEWLDKLNLEVPTTWDELYNVLKAFKTRDPNGNGQADEIPMDWAPGTGSFNATVMLSGYGIVAAFGDGTGWYVEDGKVKNYFVDERYKELVQFLHKCYKEGLVNPEVFTQDYTKYQALGRGTDEVPLVGFTFGWEPYDRVGAKWAPQYITIPPLKPYADYDGPVYWDYNYYGLNYGANHIVMTTKCENKEAAMRFMDQFYDPINGMQVLFGALGECIADNGDGTYKVLPPQDPQMDPGTWKWTNTLADAGPMYISDSLNLTLGSDMQALAEYDKVYKPYLDAIDVDNDVWPGPFIKLSQEDNSEMSLLWADLSNLINSHYAKWITEGGVEAEWDSYIKEMNNAGLPRAIEIMQKYYDEYKAKQ
ncbi:MAG TPA: hypothetical protein VIK77_04825 [Tissierellaceae bacterium]